MALWLIGAAIATLLFAVLIYPGELSLFGPRANRWLYDRAARDYQSKWQSAAYNDGRLQQRIDDHISAGIQATGLNRVLDLGCGTGRALQLSDCIADAGAHYTGIDFSAEMLAQFKEWLSGEGKDVAPRVHLLHRELGDWAAQANETQYGAVFLLEVGEFVPEFVAVVTRIAEQLPPGGALVMTRPAKLWWIFFPRRRQSRASLARLLKSLGFSAPQFIPWRGRYELVLTEKAV